MFRSLSPDVSFPTLEERILDRLEDAYAEAAARD